MRRLTSFDDENSVNKMHKQFDVKNLQSLQLGSSSKGNQRKWYSEEDNYFIKEQFFYQGKFWKDNQVEVIASVIASQMNLFEVSVLQQQACDIIDGGYVTHGVYSKMFGENKRFVSYKRLLSVNNQYFDQNTPIADKWVSVIQNVKSCTGLDYVNYLLVMSLLDYLVGNEDRHLNNFGVMQDDSGRFSLAPLFDFGLGLFEHDRVYEGMPFRECVKKMQCKPFNRDNQKVIDWLKDQYDLQQFFNGAIDLTECEIPSAKAGSYLRNRCRYLGLELIGVE